MAGDEPAEPILAAAGMAATSLRVPQLEHRLQGQINYAECIIAMELILSMYPIGAIYSAWDIVTGTIEEDGRTKADFGVVTPEVITPSEWKRYNNFALLTMQTNRESTIATKFRLSR